MHRVFLLQLLLSFVLLGVALAAGGHQLMGGWSEGDPESKDIQDAAEFATMEISKQSNSLFHKKLLRIVSVQKQVVAGFKYNITLETQHTQCKKNDAAVTDVKECAANNDLPIEICNVVVWTRAWLSKPNEFISASCFAKNKVIQEEKFRKFIIHHKPEGYKTTNEYYYRLGVFQDNLKKIKLLNTLEQGTAVYGVTKFADLTTEEFRSRYLGLKPGFTHSGNEPKRTNSTVPPTTVPTTTAPLPDSFDWRDKGAVTEVKNQGSCGSCWAFSTTGNIEGQWFLKKGQLLSLSEQELVDCDKVDEGCNGGLPSNAYEEIKRLGGLELETDYPYTGRDGKCSFNQTSAKATVSGYVNVSSDEEKMAEFLVNTGPISIGINANAMQFYFGGISHPPKFLCNPGNLDHGVLIVGYGVHTYPIFKVTLPFWTIKNSWGGSWGEQGYYRVYRGDGTCGLNLMATSAII